MGPAKTINRILFTFAFSFASNLYAQECELMQTILTQRYQDLPITKFYVVDHYLPYENYGKEMIDTILPKYIPGTIAKRLSDKINAHRSLVLNCDNSNLLLINKKQVDSLSEALRSPYVKMENDTNETYMRSFFASYTSHYFTEPVFAGKYAVIGFMRYSSSFAADMVMYLFKKEKGEYVVYKILFSTAS